MASAVSTKQAEFSVAVVLAVVVPATIAVLWPSLSSLSSFWGGIHDYQHGYLIAAISLIWLLVAARPIGALPAQPSLVGSVLLAGSLLAWLVAVRANSELGHQLLLPVGIWCSILAVTGWTLARKLVAPVAFLYFAVPIWDHLVPFLQGMSVDVNETALALAGVPAQVHENRVTVAGGTFHIIEGCSGKRFFMVTLALAVLASAVNHIKGWRFPAYLAACALLALLANWIRIFIVIYAGYVTNLQHYFVAVEHKSLGNAIFVVLLVSVFLLAHAVAPRVVEPRRTIMTGLDLPTAGFAKTQSRWLVALPLGLLVATLALAQSRTHASTESPTLGWLPMATGTWQGPLPPSTAWQPRYSAASDQRRAAYRSVSDVVELYVNVFGEQKQGEELVFYGNTLLAPGTWNRSWPVVNQPIGHNLSSFEARGADGSLWLIARVYRVGGTVTLTETSTQVAYGIMSILRPVPAGVIALASRCDENCDAARALVASFWDDMSGSLLAMVPDSVPGIADHQAY